MKYRELKIQISKADLDIVIAELTAAGYESMIIDDPDDVRDILSHPVWYKYDYINDDLTADLERDPVISYYFTDDESGEADEAAVKALIGDLIDRAQITSAKIAVSNAGDDSDWLYKWQEFFKPTHVGERIVVKPSWEDYEAAESDLVIEMDPGMAFGSGLHETTSMCIKALEKYLPSIKAERPQLKVLDVGTGTGILAVAAAMLGADECLGIEIDEDAVRVAQENIAHNGLSDRITAQ